MPLTEYQKFVKSFAAAHKGQKFPEGFAKAVAAAWRAAGHVPKGPTRKRSPPSGCVGKAQSACLPPECLWANGAKRKYCRKGTGAAKSPARKSSPAKSPARKSSPGKFTRSKLPAALHSCAGLSADNCMVAPNCYWQAKAKRCMTSSGKGVVDTMMGPSRQAMLSQIRSHPPQYGGYWW